MTQRGVEIRKIHIPGGKKNTPGDKAHKGIFDLLTKDISITGNVFSDKERESFYMEMNMLLNAGVDMRKAFDLIISEKKSRKIKQALESVKNDVVSGLSLSAALRVSNLFSEYEFYSIQIGEETGKLAGVLNDLSIYYSKKVKQRRQIISAMTYPLIVSVFAVAAVFFMMNFVVPMFEDIFKRFGGELPGITRFVLRIADIINRGFWWFILILFIIVGVVITNRRKLWFRRLYGLLLLRVPVIGKLVHKIYLTRFCNAMSMMISAKVPVLRAIQLCGQMIRFYPIQNTLAVVEADIVSGKALYESLTSFTIYPQRMIALIKAGEEVNKLDFFFTKLYQQYNDETEYQSAILGTLIEPFIIVFLGLLVGVILIAMYLPLFQMGQNF